VKVVRGRDDGPGPRGRPRASRDTAPPHPPQTQHPPQWPGQPAALHRYRALKSLTPTHTQHGAPPRSMMTRSVASASHRSSAGRSTCSSNTASPAAAACAPIAAADTSNGGATGWYSAPPHSASARDSASVGAVERPPLVGAGAALVLAGAMLNGWMASEPEAGVGWAAGTRPPRRRPSSRPTAHTRTPAPCSCGADAAASDDAAAGMPGRGGSSTAAAWATVACSAHSCASEAAAAARAAAEAGVAGRAMGAASGCVRSACTHTRRPARNSASSASGVGARSRDSAASACAASCVFSQAMLARGMFVGRYQANHFREIWTTE
jgi:hypothetical protein